MVLDYDYQRGINLRIFFGLGRQLFSLKHEPLGIRQKRFRIQEPGQMDWSRQVRPDINILELVISVKELFKNFAM